VRERYVRPPLVPAEAPAAWRGVWPFRVAVVLGLALAVVLLVLAYGRLNDSAGEDPGVQHAGSAAPAPGS